MDGEIAKRNIQRVARELGFDGCRVSGAGVAGHGGHYRSWLADGCAGEMKWLERGVDRRVDSRLVVEGARSVISLAMNYYPGVMEFEGERGDVGYKIAKYAWNEDYHDLIEEKLKDLNEMMVQMGGAQRYYTDTGPVLEKDVAASAGLGWNGKSSLQIRQGVGTWFFLAELITTLDLPVDEPAVNHCGSCTRCMVSCPTGAITEPHRVDARRCLSYLTIENPGPIPVEYRRQVGDWIYGCDICQDVCPWNRFAQRSRETKFHARQAIFQNQLRDFLALDDQQFRELFAKSPIKRIKRRGFLRNVCVALGNVGGQDDLSALERAANDDEPLIAEHAKWAIDEIEGREKR